MYKDNEPTYSSEHKRKEDEAIPRFQDIGNPSFHDGVFFENGIAGRYVDVGDETFFIPLPKADQKLNVNKKESSSE